MPEDTEGRLTAQTVAAAAHDEPEERWPLPYAAMLVTASSVVIWALIIAAVRWVMG